MHKILVLKIYCYILVLNRNSPRFKIKRPVDMLQLKQVNFSNLNPKIINYVSFLLDIRFVPDSSPKYLRRHN